MKKKYIWLPLLLFAYFIFMTLKFGLDLLKQGRIMTFVLTCVAEIVVLILLSLSLRRRQRLREARNGLPRSSEQSDNSHTP